MKIQKDNLENSVAEYTLEMPTEEVIKYRNKALKEIRENANIKGFRKGAEIPESVLVREFGEERVAQITIDKAIDKMYKELLEKEKLIPAAQGEITEIVSQKPLKLKVKIELLPEVKLEKNYRDVKLKKKSIRVTKNEVEAAIDDIKKKFTKYELDEKNSKAEMGDRVTVDTQGFDKDENELSGTDMRSYPLILGSNILVEGFEEKIVGMKAGETKKIDIKFPKDYHNADFADKDTIFEVTVHQVEKAIEPEFTPEFIEQLRGKKMDLDKFKELVKEEIRDTKEANERMEQEIKLVEELKKYAKFDIGSKLLAKKTDEVFEEIKQNIAQDGIKVEDYLKSLNLTEEEYKEKNVKPVALKRLEGEFILTEVLKNEDIEVSDEEMKPEVEKIIARFENPEVVDRLKELYVPGNKYFEELRIRMTMRKLIDSFFE